MVIGRSYAYREKRGPDTPMFKVKLLDKVGRKGKIKVRFEDGPHPGLEEYISTRQVVCAWVQRNAVIRDEQRDAQLEEYSAGLRDKAVSEAASAVLFSTGEPGAYVGETVTAMSEDELQRILDRAGLKTPPTELHRLGYRDRYGQVNLPLDAMVLVAKAFAAAEPQTVVELVAICPGRMALRSAMAARCATVSASWSPWGGDRWECLRRSGRFGRRGCRGCRQGLPSRSMFWRRRGL